MTVEVAILNSQGIALAADSAVTSGSGSRQKIFHALKLFTLSKYHPVGVMVYSSADVMGLPIETVIKVFRKRLGKKSFLHLEEYADAFKEFLLTDDTMLSHDGRVEQCESLLYNLFDSFEQEIINYLKGKYSGWEGPPNDLVSETSMVCLRYYRNRYARAKKLPGYSVEIEKQLIDLLRPTVTNLREHFHSTFQLSTRQTSFFPKMCANVLFSDLNARSETGFVIAGFGDNDYLPKLRSFEFQSSILGVHKVFDGEDVDISNGSVRIMPFAQPDMVDTFVRGRSKKFDEKLQSCIHAFFDDRTNTIGQRSDLDQTQKDSFRGTLHQMCQDLLSTVESMLDDHTRSSYLDPVESTVNVMPKNELAVMAEALVNLTAIKRRVSRAEETVGGPIDVAVISKGDGFVWIKRKNYFDKNINVSFLHNYFPKEEEHNVGITQQPA